MSNETNLSVDDFQIGKLLGRGKYGIVYLARQVKSGILVALKVLYKQYIIKERCEGQLRRELDIHSNLRQINIVRLYTWFQDDKRIFLVLEYAPGGELYGHLMKFNSFNAKLVSKIAFDIVSGLQYLHKKSIIHRDIKLENVVCSYSPELALDLNEQMNAITTSLASSQLTSSQFSSKLMDQSTQDYLLRFTFKLSDFGWSVHHPGIAQRSIFNQSRRRTQCGTLDYLPPQIVQGQQYHASADIWSVGVMIYELLQGAPPFYDDQMEVTKNNIKLAKYSFPIHFHDAAKDFIKRCLVRDMDKRASADDLAKHPFVHLWENN